jgi:N-acetylmuramoyl-L-alanine amidase
MRKLLAVLICALVVAEPACHRTPAADPAVIPTFLAVTTLLDELSGAPAGVVPDVVLNRARCVVVVPRAAGHEVSPGAAACRDESQKWTQPALVDFASASHSAADVLLIILGEHAASDLNAGHWQVKSRPGPVVSKVIIADADLTGEALSYVRTASGLTAKTVAGTVSLRQQAVEIAKAEPPSARAVVNSVTSYFNSIMPTGIILHHSAVIPGDESVPSDTGEIDEFHRARGFEIRCQGQEYHVAYHYLILADGTVKTGRPERCQGAHAKGYNSYVGIAVVGDFSSTDNPDGSKGPKVPTDAQMQALTQLCRQMMEKYHLPLQRIMRHNDVARTRCPGDRFPFATLLRNLAAQP